MSLIDLQDIWKVYDLGEVQVEALRDTTLTIALGEYVALVGPSGSDKSTLMNVVGCLDRPTRGSYRLADQEVSVMSRDQRARIRNRQIGFVFQNFNLLSRTTAVENVELALALATVDRRLRREKALALLGQVDLTARANHLPRELSMGQQQRVALARAFAKEPLLVLADEPTGNLDPRLSRDILDLLERMNRERQTAVVMVTHSPEAAARGTMHMVLEAGRIVDASPELRRPASQANVAMV